MSSCQTAVTQPINEITTAIPSEVRSAINLRPLRSANAPQNGLVSAWTMYEAEKTAPDHKLNSIFEKWPSDATYNDRNGKINENPSPVKHAPSEST